MLVVARMLIRERPVRYPRINILTTLAETANPSYKRLRNKLQKLHVLLLLRQIRELLIQKRFLVICHPQEDSKMGLLEKNVQIKGDVKVIWETLLKLLEMNKYEIEKQIPYSQIRAHAGSKAISMLLGGTKDGFRDVFVDILPQGQNVFEVGVWLGNFPGSTNRGGRVVR